MKKFILTLMLGASALGFSQNATWSNPNLTVDGVTYRATGVEYIGELNSKFTVPTNFYSAEVRAINTYYRQNYPSGIDLISTENPIRQGLNLEFTSNIDSNIKFIMGARRSVVNGEFSDQFLDVVVWNWNMSPIEQGRWNARDGLLADPHWRDIIQHMSVSRTYPNGERPPQQVYEFVWRGESIIEIPPAIELNFNRTYYIHGGAGVGILRQNNSRTPNRVGSVLSNPNAIYLEDQHGMVRGRTYYLHQ